jgi:iron complex transport system ATP-binding protein
LITKSINEISSGQLQKCLIAQTLIQNVDVILLDEPETHLDNKNRKLLADVLRKYALKYKKILFFSSHDFYLIEKSADFLLNFSKKDPSLELATKENVDTNFEFLLS